MLALKEIVQERTVRVPQEGAQSCLISVLDNTGTAKYISEGYLETLGYQQCELTGRLLFEMVHPKDIEHVQSCFARMVTTQETTVVEMRFLHKDGSWRFFEAQGSPLIEDNTLLGFLVISRQKVLVDLDLFQNFMISRQIEKVLTRRRRQ